MVLKIKDADTLALARRLASLTGESPTQAIKRAVQERLARVEKSQPAIFSKTCLHKTSWIISQRGSYR